MHFPNLSHVTLLAYGRDRFLPKHHRAQNVQSKVPYDKSCGKLNIDPFKMEVIIWKDASGYIVASVLFPKLGNSTGLMSLFIMPSALSSHAE